MKKSMNYLIAPDRFSFKIYILKTYSTMKKKIYKKKHNTHYTYKRLTSSPLPPQKQPKSFLNFKVMLASGLLHVIYTCSKYLLCNPYLNVSMLDLEGTSEDTSFDPGSNIEISSMVLLEEGLLAFAQTLTLRGNISLHKVVFCVRNFDFVGRFVHIKPTSILPSFTERPPKFTEYNKISYDRDP